MDLIGLFEPSELSADKVIHVADQVGGPAASLELDDLIKVGEDGGGALKVMSLVPSVVIGAPVAGVSGSE